MVKKKIDNGTLSMFGPSEPAPAAPPLSETTAHSSSAGDFDFQKEWRENNPARYCIDCGARETYDQFNLDKECQCGGLFSVNAKSTAQRNVVNPCPQCGRAGQKSYHPAQHGGHTHYCVNSCKPTEGESQYYFTPEGEGSVPF